MKFPVCTLAAVILTTVLTTSVRAQAQGQAQATLPSAAVPRQEAAALAQGWVLLAEGKFDEASRTAKSISSRFPRSIAALALTIEADIARGGATTALDGYESWLGARSNEEPAALRRVARAFLYEWSRQTTDAATRSQALLALAQDGDEEARSMIAAGGAGPGVRARLGDDAAVDTFLARMAATPGSKVNEIQMLAETGSKRAAPSLVKLLDDPLPANRAAAAAALGKLEYRQAATALRTLLQDPRGMIRVAAAGALFQMGDTSGAAVLEELATSEHASVRRSAALLMASQPTEAWKGLVRGLAADGDPAIRLDAARLLAPHDPDFARSIFDRLVGDSNLAIREQAALALAESPLSGFRDLRRLLRTGPGPVKVRAAGRILDLTR
ncbi:MAG TPA: HEAT repeat domain-containing protein [Vicinamibacterales bacterium]|nr:HEAT repeat domain-containing protein [Vicinamibacterales bacterium]